METTKVARVHKRKRNKEPNEILGGEGVCRNDQDLEHQHKRIHTSNMDDADVTMSAEKQEEMLEMVSGHIQELVVKDERTNDPSNASCQTKAKPRPKKVKERTKLSKSVEENRGAGDPMLNSDDSTLPARDSSGTTAAVLSEGSGVSQESALEYLQLWREEREKWSFKKKIQYWLLQNMYDRTKVPKPSFKIMLRYLEGLHGHQRELSLQKAKKLVDQYGVEGSSPPVSRRHHKRAVAIMRVLA